MSMTVSALYHADVARLRVVADHWERLAADVDATVEQLVRATRDLPHRWSGDGAQAAQQRARDLQVRIGNAHQNCDAIRAALSTFADEMAEHRQLLVNVLSEAGSMGLVVDIEAGTVAMPPDLPATDEGGIILARPTTTVDVFVSRIGDILARADDADQRATAAMQKNQIGEFDLPGPELAAIDPDIVMTTLNYGPESRAQWWHAQHQLNKDRLIAEYPEVVGAGEGIPTADRDRANRLLLRRARAETLARRQRLDEMQDGAGSRAVADADRRLAELDGVAKRLAEPGARLLGTQPPVIGRADPRWDDYPG